MFMIFLTFSFVPLAPLRPVRPLPVFIRCFRYSSHLHHDSARVRMQLQFLVQVLSVRIPAAVHYSEKLFHDHRIEGFSSHGFELMGGVVWQTKVLAQGLAEEQRLGQTEVGTGVGEVTMSIG